MPGFQDFNSLFGLVDIYQDPVVTHPHLPTIYIGHFLQKMIGAKLQLAYFLYYSQNNLRIEAFQIVFGLRRPDNVVSHLKTQISNQLFCRYAFAFRDFFPGCRYVLFGFVA